MRIHEGLQWCRATAAPLFSTRYKTALDIGRFIGHNKDMSREMKCKECKSTMTPGTYCKNQECSSSRFFNGAPDPVYRHMGVKRHDKKDLTNMCRRAKLLTLANVTSYVRIAPLYVLRLTLGALLLILGLMALIVRPLLFMCKHIRSLLLRRSKK